MPSFEPSPRRSRPALRWSRCNGAALLTPSPPGSSAPRPTQTRRVYLVSTLITGVLSQAFANEPQLEWGQGRFTPLFPKLMKLLVAVYPASSPNGL